MEAVQACHRSVPNTLRVFQICYQNQILRQGLFQGHAETKLLCQEWHLESTEVRVWQGSTSVAISTERGLHDVFATQETAVSGYQKCNVFFVFFATPCTWAPVCWERTMYVQTVKKKVDSGARRLTQASNTRQFFFLNPTCSEKTCPTHLRTTAWHSRVRSAKKSDLIDLRIF